MLCQEDQNLKKRNPRLPDAFNLLNLHIVRTKQESCFFDRG